MTLMNVAKQGCVIMATVSTQREASSVFAILGMSLHQTGKHVKTLMNAPVTLALEESAQILRVEFNANVLLGFLWVLMEELVRIMSKVSVMPCLQMASASTLLPKWFQNPLAVAALLHFPR